MPPSTWLSHSSSSQAVVPPRPQPLRPRPEQQGTSLAQPRGLPLLPAHLSAIRWWQRAGHHSVPAWPCRHGAGRHLDIRYPGGDKAPCPLPQDPPPDAGRKGTAGPSGGPCFIWFRNRDAQSYQKVRCPAFPAQVGPGGDGSGTGSGSSLCGCWGVPALPLRTAR